MVRESYIKNRKQGDKNKYIVIALSIYFLSLPLGMIHIGALGSALKLFAVVPLLAWFFYFKQIRFTAISAVQLFITGLMFLSVLWTVDLSRTLERASTNAMLFVLLLMASSITLSQDNIASLRKALVYSSRATALLMLVFSSYVEGRLYLSGTIAEDPNYLNGYLLFGLVSALYSFISAEKYRYLYIIEIGLYLFLSFMTGSRGGLLCVVAAIAFGFVIYRSKDQGIKGKAFCRKLLLIVLGLVVLKFVLDMLPDTILDRFSADTISTSNGTGRFEIWNNGFQIFKEYDVFTKFFGKGAGNIRSVFMMQGFRGLVMHNIFLETLLENGLIGLSAYISLLVSVGMKAFKNNDSFALSVFMGLVVLSMSTSLYAFKPYWNLMIFIACLPKGRALLSIKA